MNIVNELVTYPLPGGQWPALLAFWKAEWDHTAVDWLQALRGAYADSLTIQLAFAVCGGEVVGTASVYYPLQSPEVCCVSDVLTRPDMRGRGIAANLTEMGIKSAFAAGCQVAYLGNTPKPRSVYEKIGFQRIQGAMMRRVAPGQGNAEVRWYAPGQFLSVRETLWGDLPGVVCLLAQPLSVCFTDYPRGLVSARLADPVWCLATFTMIWYDVTNRGGKMFTLAGGSPHRVLGFGTLTPEPGAARAHRAVLDLVVHDQYSHGASLLLESLLAEARARRLQAVQTYVAESDQAKIGPFQKAGFRLWGMLPDQVRLGGRSLGVSLLSIAL